MNVSESLALSSKTRLPSWFRSLVCDNWLVGLVAISYILLACILEYLSGRSFVHIRFGFHWFDFFVPYFASAYFCIFLVANYISNPFKTGILPVIVRDVRSNYISFEKFAGFYLTYSLLNPFFSVFSSLKSNITHFAYFYTDRFLMELDRTIHFGRHPWELLQPVFGYPTITQLIDLLYVFWFYAVFAVCFWMAISRRRSLRVQFFLSFFLTWIVLGNILAAILSSAGPCYYGNVVDGANPYASLMAYLAASGYGPDAPLISILNQSRLWDSFVSGVPLEFGGGISAMPSLHVAIAFLFVLLGFRVNKFLGVLFSFYALAILVGSVHLGWHYAVDGYFAIVLVWMIWRFSDRFLKKIGY